MSHGELCRGKCGGYAVEGRGVCLDCGKAEVVADIVAWLKKHHRHQDVGALIPMLESGDWRKP